MMQDVTLWYITLLGGLRVTRGERTTERFRSHKIGSLLAYLSLFPHRAHTREELADLFWPDAEEETGRANLRTALAALRREIETDEASGDAPTLLSRGGGDVRLVAGAFTTDVATFERTVAQASHAATAPAEQARLLTKAAELYQGPLLPGVYEPWALGERDRLAELHQQVLSRLTRHFERAGQWTDALTWARRATAADPLSEAAHAEIIRLLMASGQTAAARRHFDESERLLEAKLGMEPSPEMRAALQTPRVPTPPPTPTQAPESAPVPESVPVALVETPDPLPSVLAPSPKMAEATVRLPLTLTPFFGREIETAQLSALLRSGGRLVTLTGTGGAGKTRLAVEAARDCVPYFGGGVWFVPLSNLSDSSRLFDVIAGAMDLPRSPEIRPLDQIALACEGDAPALLILDNFEQLVDEGAALLHELLARNPCLACLVTSRRRLLLDGEQEFTVAPLPTPNHPGTPKRLAEFPSVQLFVSRARAARPDFELTERNAASVANLCARLEGLPLAIELAAAWANTLTPAQMSERLAPQTGGQRRFDLLVSRRRDTPERHATLRAAIEWSWGLLPPDLQTFFAALSVFRGGWTLEAAEAVTGETHALEFMAELCERSLIIVEENKTDSDSDEEAGASCDDIDPTMRYRMLESLREFATEQLGEDDKARLTERHLAYFLRLAEEAEPHLTGPEQVAYLTRLEQDNDNLRAALEVTAHADDVVTDLRLTCALISFWIRHGHLREGLSHLRRALARPAEGEIAVAERMETLPGAGWLAWCLHDRDGRESAKVYSEEGLALCRKHGDLWGAALALGTLGWMAHHRSEPDQALVLIEEAVSVARAYGQPWLLGHCLRALGSVLLPRGQADRANQALTESVAALRESGDRYAIAGALRDLAMVFAAQDDRKTARQHIRESIALYHQLGEANSVGHSTLVLGYMTSADGESEEACRHFDHALRLCREAGNQYGMAHALHNRAHAYVDLQNYSGAQTDFRDSLLLFRDLGNRGDMILSLEGMATLAAVRGDWERALRLISAAEAHRTALGNPLYAGDLTRHDRQLADARAALGDAAFEAIHAAGLALPMAEAVSYALEG